MGRRKPAPYYAFGRMLEEGIKYLAARRNWGVGKAHREVAAALGVSDATLYAWRRGEHLPSTDIIAGLAEIFVTQGDMDERWFDMFLEKGKYGSPGDADALRERLFGRAGGEKKANEPRDNPASNPAAPVPWTDRVFDRFLSLGERFRAEDFLKLTAGLGLWLAAWGGMNRFLDWPFPDEQTALTACIRYGLVSLAAPAGVALLAGLDEQKIFRQLPPADRRPLWVLRMTAAYIGYHFATLVALGIAIFLYSVGFSMAAWVRAAIPASALLLAYVFAREYPVRRVDAQKGRLVWFPKTDRVVMGTFVLVSPLFAAFFYISHSFLLRPYWGSLLLGMAGALVAGREVIEKRRRGG